MLELCVHLGLGVRWQGMYTTNPEVLLYEPCGTSRFKVEEGHLMDLRWATSYFTICITLRFLLTALRMPTFRGHLADRGTSYLWWLVESKKRGCMSVCL